MSAEIGSVKRQSDNNEIMLKPKNVARQISLNSANIPGPTFYLFFEIKKCDYERIIVH